MNLNNKKYHLFNKEILELFIILKKFRGRPVETSTSNLRFGYLGHGVTNIYSCNVKHWAPIVVSVFEKRVSKKKSLYFALHILMLIINSICCFSNFRENFQTKQKTKKKPTLYRAQPWGSWIKLAIWILRKKILQIF